MNQASTSANNDFDHMVHSNTPSLRTALLVWAIASATTVLSLFLALTDRSAAQAYLGLFAVGVVVAVGCIKAALILRYYLGLGPAAGSWRSIFAAFLIVIFLGVLMAQGVIILMLP
ncbi:cytochrome C oxidase subunit IV family protein [Thalassospira sp.]|uniref:cytochrome C oxidase subunit IV family protein n=1 Tax=Thalassospira sp. TaxID=1912094 RepID=UPI003AA903C0